MRPEQAELWAWLTGGRPMQHLNIAFTDCVTGKTVHYWIDRFGRRWMANSPWSWFRLRCGK